MLLVSDAVVEVTGSAVDLCNIAPRAELDGVGSPMADMAASGLECAGGGVELDVSDAVLLDSDAAEKGMGWAVAFGAFDTRVACVASSGLTAAIDDADS